MIANKAMNGTTIILFYRENQNHAIESSSNKKSISPEKPWCAVLRPAKAMLHQRFHLFLQS